MGRFPNLDGSGFLHSRLVSTNQILLNGEPYELTGNLTVADLIGRLGMKPARIAVEVNQVVTPKAEYASKLIAAGDQVEIVDFVGGG